MREHPQWATKHRKPGTELRFINGRYYLYAITSRWDKEQKKTKKITGKLLGKITQEGGFIESNKALVNSIITPLAVKEYGASYLLADTMPDIINGLKESFPEDWQAIVAFAYCRLLHQSPIKNLGFYLNSSFLSELYPDLSNCKLEKTLKIIGQKRDKIKTFFNYFVKPGEHILLDLTNINSKSISLPLAKRGYNSHNSFDPQVNLLLIFSTTSSSPIYYRMVPGNIRDVKAFKLCLQDSSITNAILITDKGFYSEANLAELDNSELKFILPLRRNNILIDYTKLKLPLKKGMDGYFKYKNRYIWYYVYAHQDKMIYTFLDDQLKNSEERDYLDRIDTHPEEYSFEEFQDKHFKFGTITIITNLSEASAQYIYSTYKSRTNIEETMSVLKNILDVDRTYMRDEHSLEGWMFVNYIALMWYYRIYQKLVEHDLLAKHSPMDILMHLSEIKKIYINGKWHTSEITAITKKLLDKIGIHVT